MVTQAQESERKSRFLNRSRAREMRHAPAVTERHFWNEVRDRKLGGHKFRRQYLIGPYFVDYVCVEKRLIVELDGVLHADRADYDNRRDAFLREQGYRVIRFKNDDLLDDMSGTLAFLLRELGDTPSPRPSPPLREGEGEVRKNTLAPAQRGALSGSEVRQGEGDPSRKQSRMKT
jgi:very-short-patch-repair endonuclease